MKNPFLFMALLLFTGLPAFPEISGEAGSPSVALSGEAASAPAPSDSGTKPKKRRALPFRSVIYSIDEEHRAYFHMGKHKLRKVYIAPQTRFLLASGEEATVEDLRVGADVRGSYRKREDGHYDAVTLKIGTKERN